MFYKINAWLIYNNDPGDSVQWINLEDEGQNDDEGYRPRKSFINPIMDSSYAYISNNLVGIHLIKSEDNECQVKVNQYIWFF